ncbi:31 kDa immunogenic protein [Candidatus Defluviicoccus seviourii]|uniref:31 kDa immunogenic protein n=1 Tax=Candidatus Defluviicoccus seviourii TaxID=2565273 RepID=A0A564WCF5_9PROT|nr:31 kDa immunogenic protein [Candidatus Defluviicoccus seviourii]
MRALLGRALLLLVALAFGAASVQAAPATAQDVRFIRIGTGAAGGSYFPVGGLIANAISNPPGSAPCALGGSCGVPGLVAAAVSTQGAVENAQAVADGKLDLALCQADVAYFAYTGTGPWAPKPALKNLRVIANLYPELMHAVVRRDAGISAIGQMRGKRINLGEQNSGTLAVARWVLRAYNVPPSTLTASFLSLNRASSLLVEGKLDGFFMIGGYPLTAVTDSAEALPIAILPVDEAVATQLMRQHRFFARSVIPDKTYPGVGAVETLAVGAQLIVTADMDEGFVYAMTQALWDPRNRPILDGGHPLGKLIRRETALDGLAIPLHPGAARYYEQQGQTRSAPPQ